MHKIKTWLESIGWSDWHIEAISSDASFRNYYRLSRHGESYIVMDSTAMIESLQYFIEIHKRLAQAHVRVPQVIVKNMKLGYLILEDLGSMHLLDVLNETNYKTLYSKAIDEIIAMQKTDTTQLPKYDRDFLLFEMGLMEEWYVNRYLQISITSEQKEIIDETLQRIADTVLEQPQGIFVHRDYHSRNIMLTSKGEIGIIDFQDAREGAITYDLVSLLKDCYIEWPKKEIESLALYYRDVANLNVNDETFIKWFDFMGMQRHIKVLGIFSRLYLRDGKNGYLKDIPLTLKYLRETAQKYSQTQAFAMLLEHFTALSSQSDHTMTDQ